MLEPLGFTAGDLEIVREIIADQCALSADKEFSVLEWGAGGSTLLFPQFIRGHRPDFQYLSVEHSFDWYQRVVGEITKSPLFGSVHVHLEQCDGDPHREPMDAYVDYPFSLRRRHCIILVDGRKRRRCLKVASKMLALNGVVILHDARRQYYHCAFEEFARGSFIGDDLWIGAVDL